MKSIRVHAYGDTDVLTYEDVPLPEPGPGEARVKLAAIGINFIDVYHRTGLYRGNLPFTPGMEGSGVVDAVGTGVTEIGIGDRIAYAMSQGAYAEYALVPAWKLVPLPEGLAFQAAAAVMLQGMTAHYLTHSTFPLKPGDTALIHAAAGGTGLLLVQMAKMRGARVIGTVGTREKADLARRAGADETILYSQSDFEAETKRLTNNEGVHVVYDSVGLTTFEKSLNCLRPRGYLVSFGQSSGPVPPLDPILLSGKGSLFLTRPTLLHYSATREELLGRTRDLFSWIAAGELKVSIERVLPLSDAAAGHRELEGRASSGKILLVP